MVNSQSYLVAALSKVATKELSRRVILLSGLNDSVMIMSLAKGQPILFSCNINLISDKVHSISGPLSRSHCEVTDVSPSVIATDEINP